MTTKRQDPPTLDYTNKDYASLVTALLELATERMPEWTDRSPNDPGVILVELFAAMGDMLFYNQDRIASESFLETARERRSVVNLLRLIGYELRPPAPASADLTLLFKGDTTTGTVIIPTGQQFRTTRETTGTPITFQLVRAPVTIDFTTLAAYTFDAKGALVAPVASTPPAAIYRVYRTLPVVQVDAQIAKEIVGSSDGSAGQRFRLAGAPLMVDYLVLTVDEGVPAVWRRVDSLLRSEKDDRHYAVRRDEADVAWIEFGDNVHGKIPRRGRNNLTAAYLAGGGAKGNVAPRTITKVVSPIDHLKLVLNEQVASGGADAEATADAVVRGPQQNRSMGRAVTTADYAAHARTFGVAKVRAYAPGWNRVELVVAPTGGGYPTDTLKRDLRAYFDDKRMITTQVEITDPSFVEVLIEGDLTVDARYFNSQVKQRVLAVMSSLWSFDNVDFNDTLYLSKIYEAIEGVDGVEAVVISKFWRSDVPLPTAPLAPIRTDGTLRFDLNEIPNVKGITLNSVTGGRDDG